jgi:hypothetical protein
LNVRSNSAGIEMSVMVVSSETYTRRLGQFLRAKDVTLILASYPTLVNETTAERYHVELAHARIYHVEFSEQGCFDAARKLNGVVSRVASALAVPLVAPTPLYRRSPSSSETTCTKAMSERSSLPRASWRSSQRRASSVRARQEPRHTTRR